jgi:S1-C subfamily serine protease
MLLVFASGLALGGGLGAFAFSFLWAAESAREPAQAAAISKVSGWDSTAAGVDAVARIESDAARSPAPPAARPAKIARAAKAAVVAAEAAPAKQAKTAAQIARNALDFTVFVRGGHVYGAGVLLDRAGHVLTCRHVIEGLNAITVSFSDGPSFAAKVIDSDPALDIALLKIDSDRVAELVPASVTSVALGDDVFAIGAPRKMAFSLGRGMVSFVGRPFDGVYYLQTDLAMNGGSSGGPVMNDRGEVIALSSFVLRDSEGLAFALPIDYAYRRFGAHLQPPTALEGTTTAAAFEGWLAELDRAEHDKR